MTKLVVYSAVIGGYDPIRDPLNPNPEVDYVLFSDVPVRSNVWDVVLVKQDGPIKYSRRKLARHIKLLAHQFVPDAEYTIWVDGWLQLICDPFKLLPFLGENDIAMEKHHERDCVYDESAEVIRVRKVVAPIHAQQQVNRYRQEGFPEHYGLTASYLVARHQTERMKELELMWWSELKDNTLRDQLSFLPCCWRLGIECSILPHGQGKFYRSFPHARSY